MADGLPAGRGVRFEAVRFGWPGEPPLFDELSLSVEPGAIVALVGASGCGKSTLLRLAAGLLTPILGRVEAPDGERAFVFQRPTLLPWRTVAANVRLPLELGEAEGDTDAAVASALAKVGLSGDADKLPRALSGGMQMRASLARALVTRPSLMLLDEPFGALDALTRRSLHAVFLDLWRQERFTALLVTHDIDEAVLLADRVLVMRSATDGAPALIGGDQPVRLPRPRSRELLHDPALGALSRSLEAML